MDALASSLDSFIRARRLSAIEQISELKLCDDEVTQNLILIENVPATVTDYRDRERHLENLLKSLRKEAVAISSDTQVIAFRYLLGSLYINFEKFWGSTIRVIVEVVNQSKFRDLLLDIAVCHLEKTNDIIYHDASAGDENSIEDRPDHILHRNFIFQILCKFSQSLDSNNVLFMDQFFRFVEKEMLVSPFIERFTRDNLTKTPEQELKDDSDEEDLDIYVDASGLARKKQLKNVKKKVPKKCQSVSILRKRKSRETFLTAAKIILSFTDMSKIHRQEELKHLLLDLLCCRDGSIQKMAFQCLLVFDQEILGLYAPRIIKIINDKMVRTELTMFTISEDETEHIQAKHRAFLMPVLLRVLFGKMIGKLGNRSSGRDKAELRKVLIMRFVAGCSDEEVLYFFELLFDPIIKYVNVCYEDLADTLSQDSDLRSYVPLNKMLAMLTSLSIFMDSVAHLKSESLPTVLKLINIIAYYAIEPLENRESVERIAPKNIDLLKHIRRECINVTASFFKSFGYYKFSQDEVNLIFDRLVWKSTTGFIDRNYGQPTPLLRLIESFAGNKLYHKLLVKRNPLNAEEYLLHHLINLYASPKAKPFILKYIASILADIIDPDRNDLQDECDEPKNQQDLPEILDDDSAIIPTYDRSFYRVTEKLSFSLEILIAFIPTIFERLKENCQIFIERKDADYRIENNELFVLSTLSAFLKDSDQSLLGSKLLLSTLSGQKKSDLILNTIKTVQNLIGQVESCSDPTLIQLIAEILYYQRNTEQRNELCKVIELLAQKDENLNLVSRSLKLMNATSEELIGNPDIVKWNEGFKTAINYVDSLRETELNQPEVVRGPFLLLLHQTGFTINNADRLEFSIKENCLILYEKFAQKMSLIDSLKNGDFLNQFIEDLILKKFIRKGLRETNEAIKHTYIGVLRAFAIYCHEKSRTLHEFYLFCDSNQELDFWQNIRHIQLHNRSKALARLISNEKLDVVSPKTLSAYFMPLAASFLFSKAYKSISTLAENSIKLIGIICKQLNWITYESTLSYYLDLLTKAKTTYQKTNIKLITEILKNFNFDITACKEAMENDEENIKLEKRMKKRKGAMEPSSDSSVIATDAPSGRKLNPSTARMVYYSVTKKLLPRLNSCLHEMTRVEFEHDKNMSECVPEKEEIKRIPIAFAIVQLLNLLPGRYVLFRDQLPTIFLKLSSFLKSKNEAIRKTARGTLIKVMSFVGPTYMPDLLRVLKQSLDKGFQIHVLNYTIHSVLDKMPLQYGSLDHSIHELINSCFQEIFGKLAEDKDIAQILAKTFEAKKTKSYDTLMILASYISAEKLDYLMNSIKEVLKTSNESKKVNKLSTCIQKVFNGLAKNKGFPLDKMFSFIQTSIEESIPSLKVRQKVDLASTSSNNDSSRREDRFLISKDLPRERVKSRINERGNTHIIVENCLWLLLSTFESNKVLIKRKETHKKKLDGFIQLLTTCLKSSSPRCVMRSLKCIYFITQTKADSPTFETKCNSIVKKIFVLLNIYNGVGMVQGDNLEMIGMCFKTLTLLLLSCEHVQLNSNQIRALLTYIEQDLYDTLRQATAIGTLHSILLKKYDSPELLEIMIKVSDLLVTSEDEGVRSLCCKIWQTYLLDYKHEQKIFQSHLGKFMRQLDYEFVDGRKSVVRMLNIIVSRFPQNLLRENFELMFQLFAQRLVNEESKEVRDLVAQLIGLLIQKLPEQQKFLFNKLVISWAFDTNTGLKQLGMKLISVFVESCKTMFISDKERLNKVLSIIAQTLEKTEDQQEATILESSQDFIDESSNQDLRLVTSKDKCVYYSLRLFKRLLTKELIGCVENRFINHLKKIWHYIASSGLSHWHLPVVLTSCELYLIFIRKTDLIRAIQVVNPAPDHYLIWNAKRITRTLCDKFINLLDRGRESEQLLKYTVESLILLGEIVAKSSSTQEFEREYMESFENHDALQHLLNLKELPKDGFVHEHIPEATKSSKKPLNLMWLSVKVTMQARKEAALFRQTESYRRDFVLRWTAAVSQQLGIERIKPYVILFMMTPVRELTDKGKIKLNETPFLQNTKLMSEDLLKFFKALLGPETFNEVYSKLQLYYTRKRLVRKKKEAIMKVRDQERGVKRKIKQLREKGVKRRKSRQISKKDIR